MALRAIRMPDTRVTRALRPLPLSAIARDEYTLLLLLRASAFTPYASAGATARYDDTDIMRAAVAAERVVMIDICLIRRHDKDGARR